MLRDQNAVIDIGSIMVGILVTAILTAASAASLMTLIPFTQNETAKSTVDNARVLEAAVSARDGQYKTQQAIIALGRAQADATLTIQVGQGGGCFIASSKSDSGVTFYSTSRNDTISDDGSAPFDITWCIPSVEG